MDHVIATNFDGILTLYRGPDLTALLREVLAFEFDLDDPELAFEFHPELLVKAIRNPTIETLTAALDSICVDLAYSGPQE